MLYVQGMLAALVQKLVLEFQSELIEVLSIMQCRVTHTSSALPLIFAQMEGEFAHYFVKINNYNSVTLICVRKFFATLCV